MPGFPTKVVGTPTKRGKARALQIPDGLPEESNTDHKRAGLKPGAYRYRMDRQKNRTLTTRGVVFEERRHKRWRKLLGKEAQMPEGTGESRA